MYSLRFITLASILAIFCNVRAEQNAVLVIGYNNTRVNDVKKIRALAKEHLEAITVLCKKSPIAADFEAADHVIDTDLYAQQELADNVVSECKKLELKVVAVLPFSDQGTQLGSLLAETLGLPGASSRRIKAALDKSYFREKENAAAYKPQGYKPIFAQHISSKEELMRIVTQHPHGVFLKACQEGNNRGCTAVSSIQDCDRAWSFVEKYKSGGILAEELVLGAQEYSCDSVGCAAWLTLKFTSLGTSGKYRGEMGYILPAPEDEIETSKKLAAGEFMGELCGSAVGGAYHNEIFYKDNVIMAVEPNLRPAGGRIWDAACLAFEDFNPWLHWIKAMSGQPIAIEKLARNYYVGLKFIVVPRDGVVVTLSQLNSSYFETTEIVELVWMKKPGDSVITDHRDNTDFLGYILARDKDAEALDKALHLVTQKLSEEVIIQ